MVPPPKKNGSSHLKKLNFKKCYRVHYFIPLVTGKFVERKRQKSEFNKHNSTRYLSYFIGTAVRRPLIEKSLSFYVFEESFEDLCYVFKGA